MCVGLCVHLLWRISCVLCKIECVILSVPLVFLGDVCVVSCGVLCDGTRMIC